jgi:hypothetical protein
MSTASARMQTAYQLGQPVGRHRTDTRNTASGLQCNSINDSAAVMVNGTRVREGGVPGLLASQGAARMVEGVVVQVMRPAIRFACLVTGVPRL